MSEKGIVTTKSEGSPFKEGENAVKIEEVKRNWGQIELLTLAANRRYRTCT